MTRLRRGASSDWRTRYRRDPTTGVWRRAAEGGVFEYSDGDEVEQRIAAAIAEATDVSVLSPELRRHCTDWASTYHLSPLRANLLRPIAGALAVDVLEVGAGCGAITRFLGEVGARVVALEGSTRRAAIAASRCRGLANVEVVNDTFDAFEPGRRFDVVTLVGVLEYARLYGSGADPVDAMLRRARGLLADDGILLVAIENQLGLKYFAGMHEDHLGRAMAGIQDEYGPRTAVTFGRLELERRLLAAGFAAAEFALPFPDYKLPVNVILPRGRAEPGFDAAALARQVVRADRQLGIAPLFSMGEAIGVLSRNGLLADLANSFLVLARAGPRAPGFERIAPRLLAASYAMERRPAYCKSTLFVADESGIAVRRVPALVSADAPAGAVVGHSLSDERYVSGRCWGDELEAVLTRRGWSAADVATWLAVWRRHFAARARIAHGEREPALDQRVPGSLLDAIPRNLVVAPDGKGVFIDLEWESRYPITFGYLLFRSLGTALASIPAVAEPADVDELHVPTLARRAFAALGYVLTQNGIQEYIDLDHALGEAAAGSSGRPLTVQQFDAYVLRLLPDVTAWLTGRAGAEAALQAQLASERSGRERAETELLALRGELIAVTTQRAEDERRAQDAEARLRTASEAAAARDVEFEARLADARAAAAVAAQAAEQQRLDFEARIDYLSAEVAACRGEADAMRAVAARAEARAAEAARELDDSRLALSRQLAEIEREAARVSARAESRDAELSRALEAVSRDAVGLRVSLADTEAALERVRETLRMTTLQIGERERLGQALVDRARVELQQRLLAWRDAVGEALAQREREVEGLRGHNAQLESRIGDLAAMIGHRDEQLSAVRRSLSWRITKPLRKLASAAGRARAIEPAEPPPPLALLVAPPPDALLPHKAGAAALPALPPLADPTPPAAIALPEAPERVAARAIAFYLPQFHAIPENDAWWGRGFTEWTNVIKATPQFEGHDQPRVPALLGYYNLLDGETQRRQVELARRYGLGGFCFYFYWFGGTRLLDQPLSAFLRDATLEFPFCLCWANENWSRRWDGLDQDILIAQRHSPEDDEAFIAHVAQYLRDPRYIRVRGRPLLLVYRPSLLPDPMATSERWRRWCREQGVGEIYLAYTQSFEAVDPGQYGFDAAIEFAPNNSGPPIITHTVRPGPAGFEGIVYDWSVFVERSRNYAEPPYRLFRGVCPMWDNTARRGRRAAVFVNSSPAGYREWLTNAARDARRRFADPSERLVFVNAWNEWAEGAYLEPDATHGLAYLEATRAALVEALLPPRTAAAQAPLVDPQWLARCELRERVHEARAQRRDTQPPPAPAMLDFSGRDPLVVAAGIVLPAPPAEPEVTILVPAYNEVLTTLECLASIAAARRDGDPTFEVLVADDASIDATEAALARVSGLRVHRSPVNLGFLRNCNAAARQARGRYLVFLNNDVQVTPGWLGHLYRCIDGDAGIGAVGPRIVYPGGLLQEAGCAWQRDGASTMIGLGEHPDDPLHRRSRAVDYVSGACLMVRREVFLTGGGFDEAYAPAYCEDSDLCMRLRAAGLATWYCAEATIVHHLSKSSDALGRDYKLACVGRNLATFAARWHAELERADTVRVVAFYRPGFGAAGRGTRWADWTAVAAHARSHARSRLPAMLGYYDARVADTLAEQLALARRYGLDAFAFLIGVRRGELDWAPPLDALTMAPLDGFSQALCLCDDADSGVDASTTLSTVALQRIGASLARPDALRVEGRPVLVLRHAALAAASDALRRAISDRFGITPWLVATQADAAVDAVLDLPAIGAASYLDMAAATLAAPTPAWPRVPVVPAALSAEGGTDDDASPGWFQGWLEEAMALARREACGERRLVFVDAWNDWCRGAVLEPTATEGNAWLEAVSNARDAERFVRGDRYALD